MWTVLFNALCTAETAQFQMQLCIKYCTSTQNRNPIILNITEYYGHTHIDAHLGMSNVSHTCRPVLFIVLLYSSPVFFAPLLKGISIYPTHMSTQLPVSVLHRTQVVI